MSAACTSFSVPFAGQEHAQFAALLPKIRTRACIAFRTWKCAAKREDAVQECFALAWKWYVSLQQRGKDVSQFPVAFAILVVRSVQSGRRLCGQERAKDVLSVTAQWRNGFTVEGLPSSTQRTHETIYGLVTGQVELDAYEERLKDNTVTPPPDAAAFRIDFPQFLAGLTARDREMVMFLSLGNGTTETADRFGLSPGRVSQLRQQWCQEWRVLTGEEVESGARRDWAASG
jgi:DNA-directed RNA polymerase specialized sigma24 family protein